MRLRRILLWTTIGSLALGAALGIVIIFTWSGTRVGAATIASAILVSAFSLTALVCTIVLDRYRWVNVMWAGIGASGLALMLWLVAIWSDLLFVRGSVIADRLAAPGVSMTVLALWCALAGLLMLPRVDGAPARFARLATIVAAGVFGALVTLIFWLEIDPGDAAMRLLLVLLILVMLGAVVSPILARMEAVHRRSGAASPESRVEVDLACPRCGERQRLRNGPRKCVACGLRILVRVEEPRCRCGYLLYHLESDTCPECGRTAAASERWVT
jgi:hypothetical protein